MMTMLDAWMTFAMTPLPAPSPLVRWTLEQPLPTAIGLVAIGAATGLLLARRGQAKLGGLIGAALVGLGLVVIVIGTVVTTDRERLLSGTRALTESIGEGEADRAGEILSQDIALAVGGARAPAVTRDLLLRLIAGLPTNVEIQEVRLLEVEAATLGPGIGRSQFSVRTVTHGGIPTVTVWRLDWRRSADGQWRVETMDWLRMHGSRVGPDRIGDIVRFAR